MSFLKSKKPNNKKYVYKRKGVVRKKTGAFFNKIIGKSQEHLTVMFIPHSEKKIFNFQISHFTLVLIILIVISIAVVGSFSYYRSEELSTDNNAKSQQIWRVIADLNKFIKITPEVSKEVEGVYNYTDQLLIDSELKNTPLEPKNMANGMGGPLKTDTVMNPKELLKNRKQKSLRVPEINQLASLPNKLKVTQKKIDALINFLKGQKRIFKNMPSIFPVRGGGYIVSSFGWRRDPFTYRMAQHTGVDIINIPRSPIQATAAGEVLRAERGGGRGLYVEIKHKFGFTTQYLHMHDIRVTRGQKVPKGFIVGSIGNTGRSTGPHLHYEVRINGHPINPAPYIALDKYSKLR